MKILVFTSFFDDLRKTLEQHPYLIYVLAGCCAILFILIILSIVIKVSKKEMTPLEEESVVEEVVTETNELDTNEEEVVEESLEDKQLAEENAIEISEEPVEEIKEETNEESVEENQVVPTAEEPVEVSSADVKEEKEAAPMIEEPVVNNPVKKTTTKKTTISKEKKEQSPLQSSNEETLVVKETTKKQVTKKTSKKMEGKEMTKEPVKPARVVYGKYEVYSDGTSYFYILKASNGEVLIKSEAYATKDSVLLAIEAIKRNISVGTISIRKDKHGLFQFVLVAKNHRTLVMSANYSTEARAKSASQSFVRFAETSPVVELAEIIETSKELIDTSSVVDKKGGKLGVVKDEEGFYYVLKASNGVMLVRSDNYKSETSAIAALERFKETVKTGKFYVEKDKRDNYQFKLFSTAGRIVCVGQIYSSKAVAISNAMSVCSFVALATPISE